MFDFLKREIPVWLFVGTLFTGAVIQIVIQAFKKEKMEDFVNARIDNEIKSVKQNLARIINENNLIKQYLDIKLVETPDKFEKIK